jgi:putative membrane protein
MKTIHRIVISSFIVACISLASQALRAQSPKAETTPKSEQSKLSSKDTKFLHQAAAGNLMEERLGKLIGEKAQNPQLKEFGQKLTSDHAKAQEQLTQIAQQKGVTLPTELSKRESRMIEHFSSQTGADFDRTVLRHLVRDHETDIREYERASTKVEDTELKQYASTTLPILQEHLKTAQTLDSEIRTAGGLKEPAGAQQRGKGSNK